MDFDSTAVVDGAGSVFFGGGETLFTSGAAYNVSGAMGVSGGLVAFQPGSSVAALGALTISGGTVDFSTGGSAITAPTLTEWGGTLTGVDTLAVIGLTTWTGGNMTGAGETNALGMDCNSARLGVTPMSNISTPAPSATPTSQGWPRATPFTNMTAARSSILRAAR